MYAGYFGLKQAPFSIAPDPRYLFMSERHREALAHLLYGIEGGGGFVLLSGEIGAGKTTICRCFLEQIPPHCNAAYIFNPELTVDDLLKTICHEFHLEVHRDGNGPATIKDYLDQLNDYLLRSHAAGRHNILIIDEAQNLTPHVLEQLRLLTNLETSERKLLQIILIGQPGLRQMLVRPELEQLAQRVIARFHLGALNAAESCQYIQHRMGVAGLQGPLPFTDESLHRIHAITRGVPRRINLLCDRALLGTYATGLRRVERQVVDKAAGEVFEAAEAVTPAIAAPHRTRGMRLGTLALGALGGAVSAAALFWLWTATSLAPKVPTAVTGRPAAQTQTAHARPTVEPAPAPPEPTPGPPPLSALMRSEAAALRDLGLLWGLPLPGADPCANALRQQLQCFRTRRMTLHGLRQMDRPAVLTLRVPGQGNGKAVLTAITSETATLRAGERHWLMPLTALADIWHGDYTTLWRTPPGHQGHLDSRHTGPATDWLGQQIKALQASGQMPADANDLQTGIRAFQRSQGIDDDGLAGPMTFMLINRARGVNEPRLSPATP